MNNEKTEWWALSGWLGIWFLHHHRSSNRWGYTHLYTDTNKYNWQSTKRTHEKTKTFLLLVGRALCLLYSPRHQHQNTYFVDDKHDDDDDQSSVERLLSAYVMPRLAVAVKLYFALPERCRVFAFHLATLPITISVVWWRQKIRGKLTSCGGRAISCESTHCHFDPEQSSIGIVIIICKHVILIATVRVSVGVMATFKAMTSLFSIGIL